MQQERGYVEDVSVNAVALPSPLTDIDLESKIGIMR